MKTLTQEPEQKFVVFTFCMFILEIFLCNLQIKVIGKSHSPYMPDSGDFTVCVYHKIMRVLIPLHQLFNALKVMASIFNFIPWFCTVLIKEDHDWLMEAVM